MEWPDLFAIIGSLVAILSLNLVILDRIIKSAVRSLEQRDDNIEKLLNTKISIIEKKLAEHIADTNNEIKSLSDGQAKLKEMIAKLYTMIKQMGEICKEIGDKR